MKADVLRLLLSDSGAEAEGGYEYTGDAALMVDVGSSLMMIEKLRRVEVKQDSYVRVSNSRGDRYVFDVESICGVKLGRESEDSDRTGFVWGRRF